MTTFIGTDGIDTYRAIVTKSAIKLHAECGLIVSRGVTITKLFKFASAYTGTTYKRGQHALAIAELQEWIDANGTTGT